MDYLTLCQRARHEAGISGEGPTTVLNQTDQLKKVVNWVAEAWTDIQLFKPNWLFMHKEGTFNTVAATRDYLADDYAVTDLKLWDNGSFLIHDPAIGESDQNGLIYLPYGKWRNQYRNQMGARTDERPNIVTILPDNKIRLEPRPDKVYTLDFEYKRSTQLLAADADVPTNLDEDYHLMIVWGALKYYGFYEDAPEVLEEAEINYEKYESRLLIEQLPEFDEDYETLG